MNEKWVSKENIKKLKTATVFKAKQKRFFFANNNERSGHWLNGRKILLLFNDHCSSDWDESPNEQLSKLSSINKNKTIF